MGAEPYKLPKKQKPYIGSVNPRLTGYGIVQPGSKPEFQNPTPLGNPIEQIGRLIKRLRTPKKKT